jgi:tetratricopeptide (TPR) repeat protein
MREGRFLEAETRMDEALRVVSTGSDRAEVHQARRSLYERLGRIEDAMGAEEENLNALAEIVPPAQLALNRLTGLDLYLRIGRTTEALELAEQAASQLTEQVAAARALGTVPIYVALEDPKAARHDLEGLEEFVETYRVERLRPLLDSMEAAILDLEGDHAGAVALLEMAVADQPSSPSLKRKLAASLRKAGRLDDAGAQLEASLQLDPAEPLTHLEFAHLEQDRGDPRAAIEHLDLALGTWENADPDLVEMAEALELRTVLQN